MCETSTQINITSKTPQNNVEGDDVPFQFWAKLYDDIERSIVTFFSIEDIMRFLVLSKKLNKMMTRLIYNDTDFHQGFDSVTILPAIKQAIMVQYFPLDRSRIINEEEETGSGASIVSFISTESDSDNDDDDDATKLEKKKAKEEQQKQRYKQHMVKVYIEKEKIGFIKLILLKNITISKWFLNYLISDNEYLLFNLFKSNERNLGNQNKRIVFTPLIITALKALKPFELNGIKQINENAKQKKKKNKQKEKEMEKKEDEDGDANELLSLKFIHLLLSFIDEIVPKYCRKMRQFWSIFEKVLMFDHEYRYYFINLEFLSTLGDFYLREQSPYAKDVPNKKYAKMRRGDRPDYEPVIHLISILLRCCHSRSTQKRYNEAVERFENKFNESNTTKPIDHDTNNKLDQDQKMSIIMDLFALPQRSLSYHEEKYSFDDYKCMTLLELSERDKKLPMEPLFWRRMVLDTQFTMYGEGAILRYVQDMLHHWCFYDIVFSAGIIKMIIEGIDQRLFLVYHIRSYLLMMEKLISLSIDEDKLFNERFNIMFNCHDSNINLKEYLDSNSNSSDLLVYGKGATNTGGERIDLIDVIEKHMNNQQRFGIMCIEEIFGCMIKYENFGQLMIKIRDRWKMWDLWLHKYCFDKNVTRDILEHKQKELDKLWSDYSSFIESFDGKLHLVDNTKKPD